MSHFQRLRLSVLALLLSANAFAQFGIPVGNRDDSHAQPARVRELVAQYCRLDYDGVRLRSQDWPKLEPVVAWRSNPDFPIINVISRFTIDDQPVAEHGKYSINVHYRLVGRFTVGEGFSKDAASSVENVTFTVGQVNGDWRVTGVEPNYPHPSRAAMLKWLTDKLAQSDDATAKTIYQHALSDLQASGRTAATAQ